MGMFRNMHISKYDSFVDSTCFCWSNINERDGPHQGHRYIGLDIQESVQGHLNLYG